MSRLSKQTMATDIDPLLQDTWLLAVEIRERNLLVESAGLWGHCTEQVEHCRQRLLEAGMAERSVALITYAQCALIDECVLGRSDHESHSSWAAKPLQGHFFKNLDAGTQVYEDMRAVLAEPAADVRVLTCYQRLLLLGFRGCHSDLDAPQRQQLLEALNQRVPALALAPVALLAAPRRWRDWLDTLSPLSHACAAALVLAGAWWGLHAALDSAIANLPAVA